MPTRRPTPDRQDVVSRRLALLSPEHAAPRTEEPPPVPVPGRHADRRTRAALGLALGAGQLTVVAVLVAVGLAVTCWYVVRGDPERVEAPVVEPVAGASAPPLADVTPVAASATGDAPTESVTVDVTGKVRRPGIVVLEAGARVVDALEEAGGARPGVDLSSLNLARLLIDGEQVVVGVPAPVGVAAAVTPSPGAPGAPLVNLNTATQLDLETLPQVGPVTAVSILSWRDEHGGFTSVDELLEVDGIGDATLAQLAPLVTV